MSAISGTIRAGESDAIYRAVVRRRGGAQLNIYFLFLFVVICGAIGGMVVPAQRGPGMAVGVVVAFFAYGGISEILQRRGLRRYRASVGLPEETRFTVDISPGGLRYDLGDVQYSAKWNAVGELFFCKGFWVFLVRASPWVVPRRIFTDENSERTFVKSALGYMSEDARRRSAEAVTFAG